MNIVIERFHKSSYSYDGVLKIAGQKICDTAENIDSALPQGTYKVIIHTCKQYRRKMPVILVEGLELMVEGNSINHKPFARACSLSQSEATERTINQLCAKCKKLPYVCNNTTLPNVCHQIKIGNGVYHRTDGSIIIGERITWGCMKHPQEHFNRLIDRLDKASERQKQREQKNACIHSAESRPGVDDSQRGDSISLTISEHYSNQF